MVDFLIISNKVTKNGVEIYPKFRLYPKSKDLMIRGGDFYAIWIEDLGLWSTDEDEVSRIVDRELDKAAKDYESKFGIKPTVKYMWDSDSGIIDKWHKYCQKQSRDSYHMLDETLIFSNVKTTREDYATKKLPYPLEKGDIKAYDELMSTLYSPGERHKIEWAIGAIVTGDSKTIQKFMVLYGSAGTGKSTILNIIQQLFEGYYSVFDAKALGSANSSFALEPFRTNPLVAIQHDGDLSRIEDNTRLNSLVSHEEMTINEKFKSTYTNRFKAFLFMGTNKPVKITDAKSGLIRRLIDVHPSGNKLSRKDYNRCVKQIDFELGAIAYHCREVYLEDPASYDDYIPVEMMGASNDFYNFVIDSYSVFKKQDGTTMKAAWERYKVYCEEAKVPYPFSQRTFKEELKNYFWEFHEKFDEEDGPGIKNYYKGFRTDRFDVPGEKEEKDDRTADVHDSVGYLKLVEGIPSIFDQVCADSPAQYANKEESPMRKWDNVHTKLSDLDTSKLHYVKVPENHIVIDFDIKDENGEKSLEKNLAAASKWPATYAELSKGGQGIHLHYIYSGDPSKLSAIYDKDIEVKVFRGLSSLRRKLTKCNDLPIATINSGLPLKGDDKVIDFEGFKNEKALRSMIKRNLNKEISPYTRPSVDYIFNDLEKAYNSGMKYDVSDLKNAVFAFAANSSHQSDACLKIVKKMKFKSEEPSEGTDGADSPLIFYDIEVFPNLFLVNWKVEGEGKPIVRMINPKSSDIEELIRFRLVGFNCRRYDNHILYAAMMGYDNEQLYNLSQKIISSKKGDRDNGMFGEAYNISYTDIYDFASAGNKKSLKKLEIEMGIHHQELGLPWDQPVPEELWPKVSEYCDNDVLATEAAFHYLSADWMARQILADLAEMTVNDTTNSLTTRIIFGRNKKPQNEFHYRNLAEPVTELDDDMFEFLKEACPDMMAQRHGEAKSLLPYFPGYRYENGVSIYQGEEVGEGGYVYAEPGMYGNVALLDIASMHPHSTIAECLFGVRYTKAYRDIVEGRVSIKHEAWDEVNHMLDGKLTPYIQKVIDGELTSKDLANALKTAINSVYGLTSANFPNAFRDVRNKDNIVAKRGALFMVDLKRAVQDKGFTVAHIKTDSIKIPDATPEIIQFVMDFGKKYGYTFEHEATYDRMCLVNNAVYIAKYKDADECEKMYGYIPGDCKKHGNQWTATGKQFAVPYVFKTLFSDEEVTIDDLAETFEVKSALYLDMNEALPNVSEWEELQGYRAKFPDWTMHGMEKSDKAHRMLKQYANMSDEELQSKIAEGHDYRFIGKVGSFCPVKPGKGGGLLMREKDGKYYAAANTTGYRWLEAETMTSESNRDYIDMTYYNKLADDAIDAISEYGDFVWFVSDDPYVTPTKIPYDFMNVPDDSPEEVPWD